MRILQVINVTSVGDCKDAWFNSRPAEDPSIPVSEVTKLDLPVNEFAQISMFVEATILERELFTSFRNHVMWAQTSRVQDVLKFEMPNWLSDYDYFEEVREAMRNMKKSGERQDEYRMLVPVFSLCKFNIAISLRDLLKLRSFVEQEIMLSGRHEHLENWSSEFLFGIEDALRLMGLRQNNIPKYKPANLLPAFVREGDGVIGDTCVVNSEIPFGLRAQLVRHRQLLFRDNMKRLMESDLFIYADQRTKVKVKVTGLNEDMREVFSKRSCWVAHYNLWSPLLNKIDEYLHIGESGLPCADGQCPYSADVSLRYTDADPNSPCPKHAQLSGKKLSSQNILDVRHQFSKDGRPDWWKEIINSVEV